MAVLTRTYTKTYNTIDFADPYKRCNRCDNWIDGALDAPGPVTVVPCEHQSGYHDVCPSWSPVDGCDCAGYSARHPDDPIRHAMRLPTPGDGKVY